jgi:DtxR family transcriptional regulator, manganese transport regulator
MSGHPPDRSSAKVRPPQVRSAEAQASALRQTRREHSIETAQDYVEAIAELRSSIGRARQIDLARRLGVSHVTVIRTIARLQKSGFVLNRPGQGIALTAKGTRLAEESRERHEVVLEFLRSLGISEPVAEADAEGIEHHVSAETLEAFRRHLREKGQ